MITAKHGRALGPAALEDMVYADAVMKEALRNATPFAGDRARGIAVFILQQAVKTFELGGYKVSGR